MVEIQTNPYQGLKLSLLCSPKDKQQVEIQTNPYQGLKLVHDIQSKGELRFLVEIQTNPYQGLNETIQKVLLELVGATTRGWPL